MSPTTTRKMPTNPGLRLPSYFERQRVRAATKLEPVEFAPVRRNPLKPQTKIVMKQSLHGRFQNGKHYDLVAGKPYWVDQEKADEFIVKGYAEGIMSRKYSDDEVAAIRSSIQVIQTTEEMFNG